MPTAPPKIQPTICTKTSRAVRVRRTLTTCLSTQTHHEAVAWTGAELTPRYKALPKPARSKPVTNQALRRKTLLAFGPAGT